MKVNPEAAYLQWAKAMGYVQVGDPKVNPPGELTVSENINKEKITILVPEQEPQQTPEKDFSLSDVLAKKAKRKGKNNGS